MAKKFFLGKRILETEMIGEIWVDVKFLRAKTDQSIHQAGVRRSNPVYEV